MRRGAWITLVFLSALPQTAAAAEEHLTDQQQLGRRLFEQSCGVCHTRPTLVSGMYGPELSRESAGGQAEVMQAVITDGTPRMPGFKYTYNADQIAAIAAYLKTMPPGTQNIPTARTPPRPANQPANR
jgi:mono/diheme cytochrome c family protein